MLKLLLGSHGRFASGMQTSIEILSGKQNNLTILDAYVDNRNIDEELEKFFDSVSTDDQVVMLSDLYGGSVNQKMYMYLERPNTFLIAGVNLALVLELCMVQEVTSEYLEQLVEQSRMMQRVVSFDTADLESVDLDTDSDFF